MNAQRLPITDERSLIDLELEQPSPAAHDLLVRVHAVSVNPVDTKVRAPKPGAEAQTSARVLGWDAAGEVVALGSEVQGFAVGDRLYYAGDITRPGSNSELHAVDSRIAARMPESLDYAQAAALPLTALTAWEALFARMGISPESLDAGKSILIVGGAGGVGSIAIQLATRLAGLRVIATASRPESSEWVRSLGAEGVVNHREPLDRGLAELTAKGEVDFILCLNSTEHHWPAMSRAIAPQGTIASIVEVSGPLELGPLMSKSARFAWELMFTRSMFGTDDLARQGEILSRVAELVDDGTLRATTNEVLSPIDARTLRQAHARVESGHTIGKIVVAGWPS